MWRGVWTGLGGHHAYLRPAEIIDLKKKFEEDKAKMILKVRQEVNKDVEQVLEDNEYFDEKLEAVRVQVDEVKVSIRRETDRAIDALVGGLEGIIDPVSPGPSCLGVCV